MKLKVVILEFLATAVETQPGLVELFLDLSSEKDKVSPKTSLCLFFHAQFFHVSWIVKSKSYLKFCLVH